MFHKLAKIRLDNVNYYVIINESENTNSWYITSLFNEKTTYRYDEPSFALIKSLIFHNSEDILNENCSYVTFSKTFSSKDLITFFAAQKIPLWFFGCFHRQKNLNIKYFPIFTSSLFFIREKNPSIDGSLRFDISQLNEPTLDSTKDYISASMLDIYPVIRLDEINDERFESWFEAVETEKTNAASYNTISDSKIETQQPIVAVTSDKEEKSLPEKKSDVKAAALRSVARKTIDLSAIAAERAATRLAKTKSTRDEIKKICGMPIIKNALGVGIGYAIPVVPIIGTKPISKEIAEEIRIEGLSGIADATIGPLIGLFDSMMEKMPSDDIDGIKNNRIEKIDYNDLDQDNEEENDCKKRNRY